LKVEEVITAVPLRQMPDLYLNNLPFTIVHSTLEFIKKSRQSQKAIDSDSCFIIVKFEKLNVLFVSNGGYACEIQHQSLIINPKNLTGV
jgi:hypothetical protein